MSDDSYQSPWRKPPSASSNRGTTYRPRGATIRPQYQTTSAGQRQDLNPTPPERDLFDGLLTDRKVLIRPLDDDADQENVRISDCKYIGSYNWMESKENKETPTILVPGSPAYWLNRSTPYTIPPDRGNHLGDQNGFKMSKAVLLPLFLAVNKCQSISKQPVFNWSTIDIITDRNNLRKLTRWVEGESSDFRIDLQLFGDKTLLMSRWSEKYWYSYTGRTFGFSFEKASTDFAPGCKNTTGHHRIISYDLNGLKMVVRFEVDACVRPPIQLTRTNAPTSDEALTQSLSSITLTTLSSLQGSGEYPIDYPLLVREGGSEVATASIIELATRAERTLETWGYNWKETFPQLFFSQTAHYYIGVHNRGEFSRVEKRKLKDLAEHELDSQAAFKKVRTLLEQMRNLVAEDWKDKRLSLVVKNGVMGLYERSTTEGILPDVALSFFDAPSEATST
ncbi:hypothetical protein CPB83DRAFT_822723 [Crepidotus variabilis]|uniref:Geranylgeranyl pyrophosphate synthetase n=1 Tax=Crepidotus variabilis TaxID=179855 RepID=A0A9P6E543_9AGAR|nr:hypothetical protein CPB83DRAFT_822723 [Crepidotus variabilis]